MFLGGLLNSLQLTYQSADENSKRLPSIQKLRDSYFENENIFFFGVECEVFSVKD